MRSDCFMGTGLRGDGNVLELNRGGGCTTLNNKNATESVTLNV